MTMSANGTGKAVVVADTRRHENIGNPSWSPDGTKLVFDGVRFQDESQHIFVVNSDGTGLLRIDSPSGRDEFRPDWSPDGLRIVFDSRGRSFLPRITTMDPDGGNRVYVTRGDLPTWSPDGSQITFIGIGGSSFLYDVFVVNADGTGRTRLTDTPRRNEFWPAFSPDGTQIAYSRSGVGDTFDTDDIWIMNADGSSPTQITDTPRKDEFALGWQAV